MAKFTDYTQKTKPADADLLLIHDNAGAANKKTPFSGVWSWILDKLASAVISQLETTNKSIIPAINELNSKSIFNTVGTNILQNENLNNYTSPGTYACQDSSVAATLSGIPSGLNAGFRLDVIRKTNGRAMQIIFPNEPDVFYIRGFIAVNSSFGSWKKFSGVSS